MAGQPSDAAPGHTANLALHADGPITKMSKHERRLRALNKYKAKRKVSRPMHVGLCLLSPCSRLLALYSAGQQRSAEAAACCCQELCSTAPRPCLRCSTCWHISG